MEKETLSGDSDSEVYPAASPPRVQGRVPRAWECDRRETHGSQPRLSHATSYLLQGTKKATTNAAISQPSQCDSVFIRIRDLILLNIWIKMVKRTSIQFIGTIHMAVYNSIGTEIGRKEKSDIL